MNEDAKVEREEKDDFEFAEFSTAREENSEKPVEPYKRASEADVTERRVTEAFVRNVKSKDGKEKQVYSLILMLLLSV